MRKPGTTTNRPTKRTSPRPAMKHSATLSEAHARASWPLPEPTLAYFPNARFVPSGRDPDAGAARHVRGGVAVAENSNFGHVPVLLQRCVELLTPALTRYQSDWSGAVLVDATLGAGGHAERFLTELPGLRLIGLDRDPSALEIARDRLARFADRVTLVHTRYDALAAALAESGYAAAESVDGVLFDLGVSSMQLDRAERGFIRPGRAARHADGPGVTADRGRRRQHLRRGGAGGHPAPLRRGAVGAPHRRADRPPARPHPVHHDRGAGCPAVPSDSGSGPAHRRASGQAHLPGAADRRQRRADLAARRPSGRPGGAHRRRTRRGLGLPIAGRPDRQAPVRRRGRFADAGGPSVRASRTRAAIPVVDARRRTRRRRRD